MPLTGDAEPLVVRLRSCDADAFAELVDLHGPSMLRLAGDYVPSREVAEDVVQETWIAVLRGIGKFEGRSSLRTWIFSILINIAKRQGIREHRQADTAIRVGTGGTVDPERFRELAIRYRGTGKSRPRRSPIFPKDHYSPPS